MNGNTDNLNSLVAKIYTNENGSFIEVPGTPFREGGQFNSMELGDIDGDGDLDLLITGVDNQSQTVFTSLYENQGGRFSELKDTPFEGVGFGDAVFADFDSDGDQDILISGATLTGQI